jgi:hypothetical protein
LLDVKSGHGVLDEFFDVGIDENHIVFLLRGLFE